MISNWTDAAQEILNTICSTHPHVRTGSMIKKGFENWQDVRSQVDQGFEYLINEGFIKETSQGNYKATSKGLEYANEGIKKYIQAKEEKKNKEEFKEELSLKLLNDEVKRLKIKNIYWWIAAIMGVTAFVIELLDKLKII